MSINYGSKCPIRILATWMIVLTKLVDCCVLIQDLFVAETDDHQIIGSALGATDGRRGTIYHW